MNSIHIDLERLSNIATESLIFCFYYYIGHLMPCECIGAVCDGAVCVGGVCVGAVCVGAVCVGAV